jgi:hypothetical protein
MNGLRLTDSLSEFVHVCGCRDGQPNTIASTHPERNRIHVFRAHATVWLPPIVIPAGTLTLEAFPYYRPERRETF